jgi:hypothetical protein
MRRHGRQGLRRQKTVRTTIPDPAQADYVLFSTHA